MVAMGAKEQADEGGVGQAELTRLGKRSGKGMRERKEVGMTVVEKLLENQANVHTTFRF